MSLKQKLVDNPPRDRSGPRSADRFVYQQSWALCRLLALHQGPSDYVLTFDHHEDVQELDAEENPTEIKGFQVKTKESGNWTIDSLTKQEPSATPDGSPLPSVLGKLYYLKQQFPDETKLIQFVSNAYVSVKLQIDGKKHYDSQHTLFEDLHESVQQDIRERLQKELGLAQPPALSQLLEFQLSNVPLKTHETHTKGKLAEFLEAIYPARSFRIVPIYRALLSEVAVRNNNQDPINSYEDLIRFKSIIRKQFSAVLIAVGVSSLELKWETVENRLNTEGAPLALVRNLGREWDAVSLDRLSRADIIQLRLRTVIDAACKKHHIVQKLVDAIETIYAEVSPEISSTWAFSEMYIKAAIVMSIYESQ